jgi:peptidase E
LICSKDDNDALSWWNPHIIYIEGGNTFWLQHCIEKGNYSKLMITACTGSSGAVYCGKSAGAIVAGKYVETATWKGWDDPSVVPGKKSYDKWIDCKGFSFVGDNSFFPHMSNDWETLVQQKKTSKLSNTVCLREEDVCCVIGESGVKFMTSWPSVI